MAPATSFGPTANIKRTDRVRSTKPKIGVMAPASRIEAAIAGQVKEIAAALYPGRGVEFVFHPQCFKSSGHFAGDDAERTDAFVEIANDASLDALWFAKGGYGSCRLADGFVDRLGEAARDKAYLGYSDTGSLLGGLYRAGFAKVAHGPMPSDIRRAGGEAAVGRALAWLIDGAHHALEPSLAAGTKAAAFNITILGHLLGTPLEPDLGGHVLMLEETSEEMYRIDRALFHITSAPAIRRVAGIRLGRCSDIPPNDPPFERTEEEVIAFWCKRSGIPYLGRADIGHDVDNKIVPFGDIGSG